MGINRNRNWTQIALLNFIFAALAGITMRFAFFGDLHLIEFKNLLQAHSHMAMLGWVFLALILLISIHFNVFISKRSTILILTQLAVTGMFVSLLLLGYKSISIVFLFLHMLMAGFIVWKILKGSYQKKQNKLHSNLWLRSALFFLIFSFLGPLALGPISAIGLKGSALYYAAIQFFLHFQFNGWMIFGILALFFNFLETKGVVIPLKLSKRFHVLLVISCFLTYALAIAWSNPYLSVFLVNSLGVLIQLCAIILFWKLLISIFPAIRSHLSKPILWLFALSFMMFTLKIGIQSMIVFPFVAKIAYTIRFFVIGFIHLILLGVISFGIFAFLYQSKILSYENPLNKIGIKIFAIGFTLTEIWMFIQGILLWAMKGFIPYYHEVLFAFSCFLVIGLIAIIAGSLREKYSLKLESNLQYENSINK